MSSLEDFNEITERDKPLAPLTWLRVGGAADYFIQPRSIDELTRVVQCCDKNAIPVHVLGGGSNLLVRDEGVRGVVIHLANDAFSQIQMGGTTVHAGGGARLSEVISQTVRNGLAGLEALVGIPGTIGGALRGNAGGRSGEIGQVVENVRVLNERGEISTRSGDELTFTYRHSDINELVILEGTFALQSDNAETITRRLRKLWIVKKSNQPFSHQSAGCIFKNLRGVSAGALIEDAGLVGTRVGGAEVSDRHANFIVTHEGATANDVLELSDRIRDEVARQFDVELEKEIQVW